MKLLRDFMVFPRRLYLVKLGTAEVDKVQPLHYREAGRGNTRAHLYKPCGFVCGQGSPDTRGLTNAVGQ